MPVQVSYPGVYVQENPSGARTVTGVSTASTAFVDYFPRGPMSDATTANAVQVTNWRDFERIFGGLNRNSEASYAIYQYFNNGGSTAWVVRAGDGTATQSSLGVEVLSPSRKTTIDNATAAATAAKTAADAAQAAATDAQGKSGQELVDDINKVVDQTNTAAQQALATSQAAEQASQQLAAASQIAAATAGPLAQNGKDAATAASAAAEDAAAKAEAAQQAAQNASTLADQLDPAGATPPGSGQPDATKLNEVQPAINAAVQAAEAAALAAQTAAAKAADAASTSDQIEAGLAGPTLKILSANPGVWGNSLQVSIQDSVQNGSPVFTLQVQEVRKVNGVKKVVNSEKYQNLSLDELSSRYAVNAVNSSSQLIRLEYDGVKISGSYPQGIDASTTGTQYDGTYYWLPLAGGADGGLPNATQLTNAMQALNYIAPAIFTILCLPITAKYSDGEASAALTPALQYAAQNRAFLIIDPPPTVRTVSDITNWSAPYRNADNISGAVYFPRLTIPDPLNEYRPREVGPSGTVAGVYARTDVARGVWKAPAGIEAVIQGADLTAKLTDTDSGNLNPLGINVLRSFPVYGNIVWGARTLAGADLLESDYKYVPVRRVTSYIESSLFQSLKWVVFEPNDDATWSQIRQQVGSFLAGLYAQGAFQGATPDKAYFVQCDATTTTQTDIDNGIVNIIVGFAPLKPAEFVILQIEQIAGATA
ncbi:MAG TPA: phage tail sheath C-terminal domain-containing protein [Thermoanaerobaculia bacterium]|nr:phage tail sheath C-terminal domain-containing protein [Thermoanaerobaculia bacterium]